MCVGVYVRVCECACVGSAGSSARVVGAKKKQAMVIDLKEMIDLKQQAESSKREKNEKSKLEVCMCMCVCAFVCVYMCMYMCGVRLYARLCACVCTCVCVCVCVCVCMYVCVRVRVRVYVRACNVHVYACMLGLISGCACLHILYDLFHFLFHVFFNLFTHSLIFHFSHTAHQEETRAI